MSDPDMYTGAWRPGAWRGWPLVLAFAIALVCAGALWCSPASARAASWLRVCGDHGQLRCGRVSVPLDPSGRVPGQVRLFVKRFSPVEHPSGTVIALAGGPGQSSIQILPLLITTLQPALSHRALVVFDGRGIGRSQPLDCGSPFAEMPSDVLLERCARRLEPGSQFYATTDTVSDIEMVRRALSIGRFTLYGVSYGTLGALDYARAYPQHVDHLILDSVVPPDGEPAFNTSSFAAMRRTLAGACAPTCPGLAPLADLATLFTRGSRQDRELAELAVAEAMRNGDFDPQLRSAVPSLVHLAADGDAAALSRLDDLQLAAYVAENDSGSGSAVDATPKSIDVEPEATLCEDERLPWAPTDSPGVREAKLRRALDEVPESAIAPFDHTTLFAFSPAPTCAYWPTAGDAPARVSAPMPDVPTLILSGEQDVRTPLEGAAALAAQLPHATLLAVPNVGHAVLANDLSGCAARALGAFVDNTAVTPCPASAPLPVDPLPPPSVNTLTPSGGLTGAAGRALTGAVLTLRHEIGLWQWAATWIGQVHGTEAGFLFAYRVRHGVQLQAARVSYIHGLTINGDLLDRVPYDTGTITVSLDDATIGTLTLHGDGSITGRLGGQPVDMSAADREATISANGLGPVSALLAPADPATQPRA